MIKHIIILLFVCLGNFWLWFIFSKNIWIGISLLIESILFYLIINRFNKKLFILFASIYLLLVTYLFVNEFDKDIWKDTRTEALELRLRFEYLATNLGKLYKNHFAILYHYNISPRLYKIQNNLFSSLDINLYFFAGHPREKLEVNEFEKYPFILWPFFLFGVYLSLKKVKKIFLGYLIVSVLLSAFIRQNSILGPILFFPLINTILAEAFVYISDHVQT